MKNIFKLIGAVFSALLLVYLVLPGPSSIEEFKPLPNSAKSTLSGDTVQVPNVVGYFSNNYRAFVTDFYQADFGRLTALPFAPWRLNYPPEFAYTAIKDQTQSTFLEEYYYPLRGSLFVNGLEPFYEDGTPKYWGANPFVVPDGTYDEQNSQPKMVSFENKTTLRYYPVALWSRLVIWMGINLSVIGLWVVGRRIWRHG